MKTNVIYSATSSLTSALLSGAVKYGPWIVGAGILSIGAYYTARKVADYIPHIHSYLSNLQTNIAALNNGLNGINQAISSINRQPPPYQPTAQENLLQGKYKSIALLPLEEGEQIVGLDLERSTYVTTKDDVIYARSKANPNYMEQSKKESDMFHFVRPWLTVHLLNTDPTPTTQLIGGGYSKTPPVQIENKKYTGLAYIAEIKEDRTIKYKVAGYELEKIPTFTALRKIDFKDYKPMTLFSGVRIEDRSTTEWHCFTDINSSAFMHVLFVFKGNSTKMHVCFDKYSSGSYNSSSKLLEWYSSTEFITQKNATAACRSQNGYIAIGCQDGSIEIHASHPKFGSIRKCTLRMEKQGDDSSTEWAITKVAFIEGENYLMAVNENGSMQGFDFT